MEQGIKHSWIPGRWCCAGRCFTRPEETVWGRRAAPGAAWPGRGRGRWRVRFWGVAVCHTAALALWGSQGQPAQLDGLCAPHWGLHRGHLHVPPLALQHMALLDRSKSGSKKASPSLCIEKLCMRHPCPSPGHLHDFQAALSHLRL